MKKNSLKFSMIFWLILLFGFSAWAEGKEADLSDKVADASEMITPEDVVDEDAVPVTAQDLKNGDYEIQVRSSSSMFPVEETLLHVEDDSMVATMTMGGKGYLYVFPGTALEAAGAPESDYIPFEETEEGTHTFTIPVEALNVGTDCAAFSKRKEKWYDRTLVFEADSIDPANFREDFLTTSDSLGLKDGTYTAEVVLKGGSGRASVASPCFFTVENGKAAARIEFSSKNYDYVIQDGEKLLPVNTEGNSVFELSLKAFDTPVAISADTTAMSTPHEIDYTLTFSSDSIRKVEETPEVTETALTDGQEETPEVTETAPAGMLQFAHEYTLSPQEDGSWLLSVGEDHFRIDKTYDRIYLAASAAMDLFYRCGAIDAVAATGTRASDWGIPEIRQMVEDGTIVFAGKYNAPDYEYLLAEGCDLAVESTMIWHSPEVKEKLEALGIPVLVERSSYEADPMGRMEWIKLYGLLTGHYDEAAAFFEKKTQELEAIRSTENTGRSVAFFYINTNGQPVVRKPGDYVSRMIEMAGGRYFLSEEGGKESGTSTMNMQMEAFVEAASDVDILIYNSSIDAELQSLDELIAKDGLLADFSAVRNGNVWCTGKNMFQETSGIADMILEMHEILEGTVDEDDPLRYFHKLV